MSLGVLAGSCPSLLLLCIKGELLEITVNNENLNMFISVFRNNTLNTNVDGAGFYANKMIVDGITNIIRDLNDTFSNASISDMIRSEGLINTIKTLFSTLCFIRRLRLFQ